MVSSSVKTRRYLAEVAGWYGMGAILLAYSLVSFSIIDGSSAIYQLLNATGALGVIVISVVKEVRQSVVLNLIWLVIACVGLVRSFLT